MDDTEVSWQHHYFVSLISAGKEVRTGFDGLLVEKFDLCWLPVTDDMSPVVEGDRGGIIDLGDHDDGICDDEG